MKENNRKYVELNYETPTKIVVSHGWIVDGLNINGLSRGGKGGNETIIHLKQGEKIKRIHGTRCK